MSTVSNYPNDYQMLKVCKIWTQKKHLNEEETFKRRRNILQY